MHLPSVAIALIVIAVAICVWLYLRASRKGQSIGDLEKLFRALILATGSGSILRVNIPDSPIRLDILRASSEKENVMVHIRVPRAEWSIAKLSDIKTWLEDNSYDYSLVSDPLSSYALVIEIIIEEIWVNSGANAISKVFRGVLRELGQSENGPFDIMFESSPSYRVMRRVQDGKSIPDR